MGVEGWFQFLVSTAIAIYGLYLTKTQGNLHRRASGAGSVYRNDSWIRRYWPIATMAVLNLLVWVPFVYKLLTAVEPDNYLSRWGGGGTNCQANIIMSELVGYAETDEVALACWLQDSTLDERQNTAFTVSNLLAIDRKTLVRPVTAPWSEAMIKGAETLFQNAVDARSLPSNTQGTGQVVVYFQAILLPKNSDVRKVSKLADVEPLGGKILGGSVSHTRTISFTSVAGQK